MSRISPSSPPDESWWTDFWQEMRALRSDLFAPLKHVLIMATRPWWTWIDVDGFPIGFLDDISPAEVDACSAHLHDALGLIEAALPQSARRLRRDVKKILCINTSRARGTFLQHQRYCVLDLAYVIKCDVPALARTLLPEATHARLHHLGIRQYGRHIRRAERICKRAERILSRRLAGRAAAAKATQFEATAEARVAANRMSMDE